MNRPLKHFFVLHEGRWQKSNDPIQQIETHLPELDSMSDTYFALPAALEILQQLVTFEAIEDHKGPPKSFDDFKKRNPHLDGFWPYLEKLREESDRGAVLISTGYLEQQLKDILLAFMVDDTNVSKLLEGGYAPLGSFSSRIAACYAFGLLSENEHYDLHQLRKIRNDFAHDLHTSFETQSVIDRCAMLRHKVHDYTSEERGEVVIDAPGQFRTAAVGLIMNLTNRAHYVAKERRTAKSRPY